MNDQPTFEMACIFTGVETHLAVMIIDPASGEEIWIPLSQAEEMHRNPDHTGTIVMTEWIARQKGLC